MTDENVHLFFHYSVTMLEHFFSLDTFTEDFSIPNCIKAIISLIRTMIILFPNHPSILEAFPSLYQAAMTLFNPSHILVRFSAKLLGAMLLFIQILFFNLFQM